MSLARLGSNLVINLMLFPHPRLSISPEMRASGLYSPFGSLDDKHARQTHWLLVSTLNLAYPDHDFSAVRADQFQREPGGVQGVLGALSGVMNLGSNANGSSP